MAHSVGSSAVESGKNLIGDGYVTIEGRIRRGKCHFPGISRNTDSAIEKQPGPNRPCRSARMSNVAANDPKSSWLYRVAFSPSVVIPLCAGWCRCLSLRIDRAGTVGASTPPRDNAHDRFTGLISVVHAGSFTIRISGAPARVHSCDLQLASNATADNILGRPWVAKNDVSCFAGQVAENKPLTNAGCISCEFHSVSKESVSP